jgi:hypothetical protein
MCVADMRGFMTNPGPAFRDSRCEPFAPFSKFRVACLNALVIRPSFGTRPENQRVAAKQIIGCIEFHNPAKNHIANRFQPRCKLKKSSPHFRTHPLLAEDSRETRIGLSAAARKAAETLAKMPGSKVIKHAQAHRQVTASSSVLHGWDDKGNPIPFTLNVLNIGGTGMRIGKPDSLDAS